jgi:hypothetical protein
MIDMEEYVYVCVCVCVCVSSIHEVPPPMCHHDLYLHSVIL